MCEEMNEFCDEAIGLIQRYGKCLIRDPKCDMEQEWKELSPIIGYFYTEVEKYTISQKVFQSFMDEIGGTDDNNDNTDDNSMVNEYLAELETTHDTMDLWEDTEKYKEFKNLMLNNAAKKHDESDIRAVSENVNLVDPLTKLPLTDPVKNVICGHIYEKATILQLIQAKKNIKCPIPGCVAASCVRENDLIPDLALKRHLERTQQA